jgi:hypothetical protein
MHHPSRPRPDGRTGLAGLTAHPVRMLLQAVMALLPVGSLWAESRSSADYLLQHETIAPGGLRATSANYALVAEVGAEGGASSAADYRLHRSFVGQLSEPPVAETDLAYLGAGTRLKVSVAALLRNDHDAEGDGLALAGFDAVSAAGGSVISEGGWLVYQAPPAFAGSDTLTYRLADASGEEAAGFVFIQARPDTGGVSFNVVAAEVLAGGSVRVRCVGIPGRSYAVQASDSLHAPNWTTLSTPAAAANGRFDAIDADAALHSTRYYRTLEP